MNDSICNFLEDYVDGDLSDSLKLEFKTHLESCEACRAEISELNELSSAVKAAWQQVVLTGPDMEIARRNTVNQSGQSNGSSVARILIAAALAASLLMAIGFSWFWQHDGSELVDSGPVVEETSNEAIQHEAVGVFTAESSDLQERYHTSYASAKFDETSQGVKIGSSPEFTVYHVAPKVTFSRTN